jgi:hypothetical protein
MNESIHITETATLTPEQAQEIDAFLIGSDGSNQDKPQESKPDTLQDKAGEQSLMVVSVVALPSAGAQEGVSEQPAGHEKTAQIKVAPRSHQRKGEKKKKERGLSAKEAVAVAMLQAGYSKKDALLTAGYSQNTATKNPDAVLGKNAVVRALMKAFEKRGINEDRLAEKQAELLDANKVVSAVIIGSDATEKTHDFVEVPDNLTRVKALELAYKVRGDFAPELHAVVTESYGQRIKRLRGEASE